MTRTLSRGCLILLVVLVVLGLFRSPESDLVGDTFRLAPGWQHWLGTDTVGRDVLGRLAHGTLATLAVSGIAVIISSIIAVALGTCAVLLPPSLRGSVCALADGMLAFPRLVLLLTVAAVVNIDGVWALAVLLGLTTWMRSMRLAHDAVETQLTKAHVDASRAAGAGPWAIAGNHLIPEATRVVAAVAPLRLSSLILASASLNYLGMGIPANRPSWGGILREGQEVLFDAPWIASSAVVFICLATVGLALGVDSHDESRARTV